MTIFLKMMKVLDHSEIPEKCSWPRSCWFVENEELKNISSLLRVSSTQTFVRQDRRDFMETIWKKRLSAVTWRIHNDLINEVLMTVQKKRSKVVEQFVICCVCRWRYIRKDLEDVKIFLNAVRTVTGCVATVDDNDLMNVYQVSVAHLETLFIKSCQNLDPLYIRQ